MKTLVMTTIFVVTVVINAFGGNIQENFAYNEVMNGNQVESQIVYKVENGKFLQNHLKYNFIYDAQGRTIQKEALKWKVSTLRRVCDKVVAVNVSPIMAQDYKMNIVSIAMRSFHFMFRANTFPEREKCDLLIEPYNLYGYSNTELEKAEEIFEQGYNTANGVLNQLLVEKGKIWK